MMATTPEQIDLWRQSPSEHPRLEFKEAKEQLDNRKLYQYCVAMANEGGGHLLLGVADKSPRQVVGTHAFRDPIEMAGKLFQMVGFRVDIEEVAHPDGRVLVFHIPPRPRGTAYHLEGAYLMRSGEALVPMSEDQLRRIFAEGQPDWLEDHSMTGLDAQQVVELLDTQTLFELVKLPYPTERLGVVDKLLKERLVDELSGGFAVRRLGGLMLAKRLTDFPRPGPEGAASGGVYRRVEAGDSPGSDGDHGVRRGLSEARGVCHGPTAAERSDRGRATQGGEARA